MLRRRSFSTASVCSISTWLLGVPSHQASVWSEALDEKISHAEHGFMWYMYAMAKCQWRYICMTVLWPLLIASDGMAENADIHQSSLGLGHS